MVLWENENFLTSSLLFVVVVVVVVVVFNFTLLQRALVLEDYAPALGVRGFVSRKKGARSMGQEKKEGENNNNNE